MLKQMNLEDMMLSGMSHSQKDKILYGSIYVRYLLQIYRYIKQESGGRGLGEGVMGSESSTGTEFQF